MGADIEANQEVCIDSPICDFFNSGYPMTEHNLSMLQGSGVTGQWQLCIGDAVASFVGTLVSWEIQLTCEGGQLVRSNNILDGIIPDGGYDGTLDSMLCSAITID
jgi:subtilisin-like proprotein convertase family protein